MTNQQGHLFRTRRITATSMGWLVALVGLAAGVLGSYWLYDFKHGAEIVVYSPNAFIFSTILALVLITVGAVVGLKSSTASRLRRAIAAILTLVAIAAIVPALFVGYQGYATFAMEYGNSVLSRGETFDPGPLGGLLVILAPCVLFVGWGLTARFRGIGFVGIAIFLIVFGTAVALTGLSFLGVNWYAGETAYSLAGWQEWSGRGFAIAGIWAAALVASVVAALGFERSWSLRARATALS